MPSRILRLWNPDAAAWEEVGDSRLTAHLAAADPHSQYLTASEADTLFLTQSEGDARYAAIGGGGGGAMATDALWDAKGDLAVGSGANAGARLAPGTDGQVLTADSTQSLGVKWAAAASGGLADPTTTGGDLLVRAVAGGGAGPALYGNQATGTWGWGWASHPTMTWGTRFQVTAAGTLTHAAYYRGGAGTTWSRLLVYNGAGAVVWQTTTPTDSGAVGWQATPISPALAVTPGVTYTVAGTLGGVMYTAGNTTPVNRAAPPGAFVFDAVPSHTASGAPVYPTTANSGEFIALSVTYESAGGAGVVRLPVGTNGQVLTADSAQPVGVRWATQPAYLTQAVADPLYLSPTEGDAAYLKLTGGTLTGNLGVGVAPAGWGGGLKAVQVGALGALHGGTTYTVLSDNTYNDGAASRTLAVGASSLVVLSGGGAIVQTAPSVAAGASQTFTTRLAVDANGTTTITPTAGQAAINATMRPGYGGFLLTEGATSLGAAKLYSGTTLELDTTGGGVYPSRDNAISFGHPAFRWTYLAAVAGSINTSLAEAKQAITPLAPEDALAAVRATDPVLFDYRPPERGPEWYELPDDPEQAAQVLEQRLRAAPLEAGARHQAGFVLSSTDFSTDPLFETGEGQSNAANTAGILLAAIKQLDARLTAVEGA